MKHCLALLALVACFSATTVAQSDGAVVGAQVMNLGGGGSGTGANSINSTLPTLGSAITISGDLGGAASGGFMSLVMSLPGFALDFPFTGASANGPGTIFVDINAFTGLGVHAVGGPNGSWSTTGFVPNDPGAAGVQFNVQGVFFSNATGIVLTDAVELTLGL